MSVTVSVRNHAINHKDTIASVHLTRTRGRNTNTIIIINYSTSIAIHACTSATIYSPPLLSEKYAYFHEDG